MYRQLDINGYVTYFVLGCNKEEKLDKRKVLIDISLRFKDSQISCKTDKLEDTICYNSLLQFIESKLNGMEFNLIEKATQFVYDAVIEYLEKLVDLRNFDTKIMIMVRLTKPLPLYPEQSLEKASFTISDWY